MKAAFPALLIVIHCIPLMGQNTSADAFAQGLSLIQKGQSASAIETLRPLADLESQTSTDRARIQTMLGFAYKQSGQFALARQYFEKALANLGNSAALDPDRATTLDYFASLETDAGNISSAENLFLQALKIDKRLMEHERLTDLYIHLAGLEIEKRRFKEAKRYLNLALSEQQQTGQSQTELLAELYVTKGWLANASKHYHEAVDDYTQALAACQRSYGDNHPVVGWSYLLLGKAQGESGDLNDAFDAMGKGLSILKNSVGIHDVKYLIGEIAYSKLLDRAGKHEEAQRLSAEAEDSLPLAFKARCRDCSTSAWSLRFH
ncbi:MAG: tetratricopeptide repeat protein [Deltaproteobacteria bacterium]|nr:tetratricopeptide repeat protein [Deltaproteobacteria bacterium]